MSVFRRFLGVPQIGRFCLFLPVFAVFSVFAVFAVFQCFSVFLGECGVLASEGASDVRVE